MTYETTFLLYLKLYSFTFSSFQLFIKGCARCFVLLTLCSALFSTASFANDQTSPTYLKVIRGVASQQRTTNYFHELLAEALKIAGQDRSYHLLPVDFEFSQNRTLKLLNHPGVLDITYSMTSPSRENDYIAIKVPLLNGLYGKRRLLVAAPNKSLFEQLELKELRKMIACQGLHWPDYQRLKQNGFSVYGVNDYEANFKMLGKGRCDYLPRGVAEIELDYEKYNGVHAEMAMVDNIMFVSEAPVYFFVGRHNYELANVVDKGLQTLQKNGLLTERLKASNAFPFDESFEKSPNLKVVELN